MSVMLHHVLRDKPLYIHLVTKKKTNVWAELMTYHLLLTAEVGQINVWVRCYWLSDKTVISCKIILHNFKLCGCR